MGKVKIRYAQTRIWLLTVQNLPSTDKDLVILEASNPQFFGATFIGASGALVKLWRSSSELSNIHMESLEA